MGWDGISGMGLGWDGLAWHGHSGQEGIKLVGPSLALGWVPSPVGEDKADSALAEADQEAAQGLILQQLLCLPVGRDTEPFNLIPFM